MHNALDLVSIAGGFGAAYLCTKFMAPWLRSTEAEGGPRWRRADLITGLSTVGAFIGGAIATNLIFSWLG